MPLSVAAAAGQVADPSLIKDPKSLQDVWLFKLPREAPSKAFVLIKCVVSWVQPPGSLLVLALSPTGAALLMRSSFSSPPATSAEQLHLPAAEATEHTR